MYTDFTLPLKEIMDHNLGASKQSTLKMSIVLASTPKAVSKKQFKIDWRKEQEQVLPSSHLFQAASSLPVIVYKLITVRYKF